MTLEEILQLERHLESGFQGVLRSAVPDTYHSRENESAKTPRIDLKAIVGAVHGQRHLFESGKEMFNTWQGSLGTTATTNRTTEDRSATHNNLIGALRARLQRFILIPEWRKHCDAVLLVDIREDGTDDSVVDTDDLDKTRINWQILFSLNPEALPTNL